MTLYHLEASFIGYIHSYHMDTDSLSQVILICNLTQVSQIISTLITLEGAYTSATVNLRMFFFSSLSLFMIFFGHTFWINHEFFVEKKTGSLFFPQDILKLFI